MTPLETHNQRQRPPATAPDLRQRDERLECLVRLAGRLAHDFNNFLVPVLGYAALIREEASADSTIAHYAAAMEKSARKTENAIEDILIAARTQRQFVPRPRDFAQVVGQELAEWEKSLPAHAAIQVSSALAPCWLSLDEAQCRIMLKHLLRNARLALATGGALRVTLTPATLPIDEADKLGLAYRDFALLTVADNGIGMTTEVAQRAFEPFFSTRPVNKALGVGLAVVHTIVRAHGGQIVLESREHEGTNLRIWLPVMPAQEPAANNESPKTTGPGVRAARSSKILLIMDDPFLSESIKGALQRAGFESFLARHPQEAQKFFQNHRGEIAAAIVDVSADRSPIPDGLVRLRETQNMLPLIVIRGGDGGLEKLPPAPSPVWEIKKPFAMKGLLETVAGLLR